MANGDIPPLSRTSRLNRLSQLSHGRSRRNSDFNPPDTLPEDKDQPSINQPQSERGTDQEGDGLLLLGAPEPENHHEEPTNKPDVDNEHKEKNIERDAHVAQHETDEENSYDLKPPPPKVSQSNVEDFTSRFFSADHLDLILRDSSYAARFKRFLNTYKPQCIPALKHYLVLRKAFAAVEYANAISHQIPNAPDNPSFVAAHYDDAFGQTLKDAADALVEDAFPAYLTNRLVSTVTESLVKDITGNNAPIMKGLIQNLAEVYCLSDPSLEDNPIVYASEEFFNQSQYASKYVIGRNCRFLQGRETSKTVVGRLKDAIAAGEESCETILNYQRDGSPFVNLLMIAPLYDNNGEVRYFLGAQIDVTPLIEGGKVLDSFAQLLAQDESESHVQNNNHSDSLSPLGELSEMLDEREVGFIKSRLRHENPGSKELGSLKKRPNQRRVLSSDEDSYAAQGSVGRLWPDDSLGSSGRLPGVYRNVGIVKRPSQYVQADGIQYLLVRPYPSLRITFTSPALRIPGMLQTKLLDRIEGPEQVREGLIDALSNGTGVTAKVSWLTSAASNGAHEYVSRGERKTRWIHCTPLLGSDDKVGVWMVVLVEEEEVTGMLNRHTSDRSSRSATPRPFDEADSRSPNTRLYADYLRSDKDDRPQTNGSRETA